VGPLAGAIGAAVCALLWKETGDAFWIGQAGLTALLNVLNRRHWVMSSAWRRCRLPAANGEILLRLLDGLGVVVN
jgi:hypothetical protein